MDAPGVQATVPSATYQTARNSSLGTSPILRPSTAPEAGASVQSESLDFISAVASTPAPIDSQKIKAIRDLIGSGAYPIDAHAIAAKMVSLDLRG